MTRFTLPGDERLEALIRESFEAMPGPDMRRLEQLESRLARTVTHTGRQRVNTLPWWIVLLLTGGFATAWWWVAEHMFNAPGDEQATLNEMTEQPETVEQLNNVNSGQIETEDSPVGQSPEQKSPVIYTRENF